MSESGRQRRSDVVGKEADRNHSAGLGALASEPKCALGATLQRTGPTVARSHPVVRRTIHDMKRYQGPSLVITAPGRAAPRIRDATCKLGCLPARCAASLLVPDTSVIWCFGALVLLQPFFLEARKRTEPNRNKRTIFRVFVSSYLPMLTLFEHEHEHEYEYGRVGRESRLLFVRSASVSVIVKRDRSPEPKNEERRTQHVECARTTFAEMVQEHRC